MFEPSLKRQSQSVALVLEGIALIVVCLVIINNLSGKLDAPALTAWFLSGIWLAGGVLIGAGVSHLFGAWTLGAAIGFAIQAILLMLIYQGLQGLGGG
jgi:hypothetical protein